MYEYRKLTPVEREKLVQGRLANGFPPHQPPHPVRDWPLYLLTAASYQHQPLINTPEKRQDLLNLLFEQFISKGMEILAWVVLANHYHLLVHVCEFDALSDIFRRVHGRTSHDWND